MRQQADSTRRRAPGVDLSAGLSPLWEHARRVASYAGLAHEPYVPPQVGWLLPVLLADGDLDWAVYDGVLVRGRRGVPEPTGPRLGVQAIAGCDLVLVPALLVDRHGNRLGKGGGSYDRALARVGPDVLTVALVPDDGIVEALPTDPWDVPVRAVATPSQGVVRLS